MGGDIIIIEQLLTAWKGEALLACSVLLFAPVCNRVNCRFGSSNRENNERAVEDGC